MLSPAGYLNLDSFKVSFRFLFRGRVEENLDRICSEQFDLYVNQVEDGTIARQVARELQKRQVPVVGLVPLEDGDVEEKHPPGGRNGLSANTSHLEPAYPVQYGRLDGNGRAGSYCLVVLDIGGTSVVLDPAKIYRIRQNPEQSQPASLEAFDASTHSQRHKLPITSIRFRDSESVVCAPPAFFSLAATPPTIETQIIEDCFPGGHAALFNILVSAALSRSAPYRERDERCAERHNTIAGFYDSMVDAINVTQHRLAPFIGIFDYGGTVLDCCCGTGALAKFAVEKGVYTQSRLYGIDISPRMTAVRAVKELYVQPITIGTLQATALQRGIEAYDHVVCFGSFHLFTRHDFIASLALMFLAARKSVSFDVDDLSPTYIAGAVTVTQKEEGSSWENFNNNNVAAAMAFGVPKGWRSVVWNSRRFAYHSPHMHEDVWTHSFRFEREEPGVTLAQGDVDNGVSPLHSWDC